MRARIVRGALTLAVALLIPACNYSFFFTGGGPPPPPGNQPFPFALQLPIDGAINVIANPQLSWTSKSGALSYWLQISTTSDFSNVIWDQPDLTITSLFLQPTLTNFTTFYWRIYAVMAGGGTVLAGGSPYRFRTNGGGFSVPPAFFTIYPSNLSTAIFRTPFFVWQGTPGADSYTLQVDVNSNFSAPLVDLPGIHINQALCPVTLAAMTTYFWRVIAVGQAGSTTSSLPYAQFETGP
jgi:hypothetical protein